MTPQPGDRGQEVNNCKADEGRVARAVARPSPLRSEQSGRTQARYRSANGESLLPAPSRDSPVPQSVPRPVSCVPHYHPGRRDFPGPVGSESISSCYLPGHAQRVKQWRAYAARGRFEARLARSAS